MVRAGGLELHVQLMGRGPLLLCLHGSGASTHTWRGLAPLLADRFTLLALDLPGHGYSAAPGRGRFGMEAMADVILDLLARLELCPELAIGHSAGAALACRLSLDGALPLRGIVAINPALRAPRGLQGLLFTTAARGLVATPLVAGLVAGRARRRGAIERLLRSIGSRIDADGLQQYRHLFSNPRHVASVIAMMSEWDLHRLEPRLSLLRPPMLILSGARDGAVPPTDIRYLRRRLPDVQILELEAVGHLAHEEMPVRVAEEIDRWIGSLQGGSAAAATVGGPVS